MFSHDGNRTEWSPIRSVIILSDNKIDLFITSIMGLQTELDDTKSYYQLIIKITISEKEKYQGTKRENLY